MPDTCAVCRCIVKHHTRSELFVDRRRFENGYANYQVMKTSVFLCLDCDKKVMTEIQKIIPFDEVV